MNVGLEAERTADSKVVTATGLCQEGPRGRHGRAVWGGQHPGLSPCAQRHSEHVTQLLTVKDEAGQAPLSPSLTKSES